MIRMIDSEFTFPKVKPHPLHTRIKSYFNAYGNKYAFARFWYQERNGEVTALISRVDGNMTLWCNEKWNKEEFVSFAKAVGFVCLTTTESLAFSVLRTGLIFYKHNTAEHLEVTPDLQRASEVVKAVHELEDFNAWYTDMNYRIRHGCAAVYSYIGEACAFAHLADDSALLFCIATKPESRRKGYASKCLDMFTRSLKEHHQFILCRPSVKPFYESNGFEQVDEFYEYSMQR